MSIRRVCGVVLGGAACLGLAGCVEPPPPGPSVVAVPGKGKTYVRFQQEDAYCRQSALAQNGGRTPAQAQANSGVSSALLGTALGAVAGTVIGAAAGNPGMGAGIGAGTGLAFGAASGAGAGEESAALLQRRYDVAYSQCMVAYGNAIQGPQPVVAYVPSYAPPPVVVASPPPVVVAPPPPPVVVAPPPVYAAPAY